MPRTLKMQLAAASERSLSDPVSGDESLESQAFYHLPCFLLLPLASETQPLHSNDGVRDRSMCLHACELCVLCLALDCFLLHLEAAVMPLKGVELSWHQISRRNRAGLFEFHSTPSSISEGSSPDRSGCVS